MARAREISILMITHKFREVTSFADEVTVLRRGRVSGQGPVKDLTTAEMASMMVGGEVPRASSARTEHADRARSGSRFTTCARSTIAASGCSTG